MSQRGLKWSRVWRTRWRAWGRLVSGAVTVPAGFDDRLVGNLGDPVGYRPWVLVGWPSFSCPCSSPSARSWDYQWPQALLLVLGETRPQMAVQGGRCRGTVQTACEAQRDWGMGCVTRWGRLACDKPLRVLWLVTELGATWGAGRGRTRAPSPSAEGLSCGCRTPVTGQSA